MVYNTLENFPDWKRANGNALLSVLSVEGKKIPSVDPDFLEDGGSHLLPRAPLPLASTPEGVGVWEREEADRWWKTGVNLEFLSLLSKFHEV